LPTSIIRSIDPIDEIFCQTGDLIVMPEANSIDKLRFVLGDKYEIVKRIASGGMGEIYLGIHRVLGKKRAIKVIHQSVEKEKDIRQRFLQEAKLAASIDHPGIIQIMDFGSHDDFDYLIMPYIEGATLQEEMEKGPFDLDAALDRMMAMTDALAHAHRQNIIHRDIKPSNFMIDADGRIILTDFGISKNLGDPNLTATNMILGSPKFMSPEQISGKPVDRRSDLYSLGLIFYQMVTGRYPFESADIASLAYKQVNEHPPSPFQMNARVPGPLSDIIARLLEKNPDARYPGGDDLLKDLTLLKQRGLPQAGEQAAGDSKSFEEMATRVVSRDRTGVAGGAAGDASGPFPFRSPAAGTGKKRKAARLFLAAGFFIICLVVVFFAVDPLKRHVAKLVFKKETLPVLRAKADREEAFLKGFKSHAGPLMAADVRELGRLSVCVKEGSDGQSQTLPDLRRFLAAIPFVRLDGKRGCDVLIDAVHTPSSGALAIASNLYDCPGECSEQFIITDSGGIPFDRIESFLTRNYCFNLFQSLHLISADTGSPAMRLDIPGKTENVFAVGEQVQFCLEPPYNAHTMLLNVNADGVFKLFPLDRGQRAQLIKDETACTRMVQVSPPLGNEMIVAIASAPAGVVDEFSRQFDSGMPVFSWNYEASAQHSAIDLSETLFRQLAGQPAGSWTVKSRYIHVVDPN